MILLTCGCFSSVAGTGRLSVHRCPPLLALLSVANRTAVLFHSRHARDERLSYAKKGIEKNLSYFKGASKKSVSQGQLSLFHYSNLFSSDVRVSEICSYLFLNGYLSTTKGRDVDYPNIMVRNAIDEMLHHIQESADL